MNKLFCGECKSLLNYIRRDPDELVSFKTCKKSKQELPYEQMCKTCGFRTRYVKKL